MYKVMIADDEHMVRKGLVHLIDWKKIDCELVYAAVDGQDILEHLELYNPDILISDIKMPRMDGIDVARYLWEQNSKVKLTLLTAYADFSYAKSAIKYGVVDYVTKTGALDGIVEAVEKSKELLKREQSEINLGQLDAMKISVMKSIIDGTVFEADAINKLAVQYNLELTDYVALAIKIDSNSLQDPLDEQIHSNMEKFLKMSLSEYHSSIVPLTKNTFCVVIHHISSHYSDIADQICSDIVNVVDSFMMRRVYIGISELADAPHMLSKAYQQAALALSTRFLSEEVNIYHYGRLEKQTGVYSHQTDKFIDKLSIEIQKGLSDNAVQILEQLFEFQMQNHSSEVDIKKDGLLIENKCKKYAAAYNTTLAEVFEYRTETQSDLLESVFFSEYKELLQQLVIATCDYIYELSKGKNNIIIETMHYINENYAKNITLNDIAKHTNVNSSYLSRLFKEKTGDTLINTINHKKIEKAKDFLSNTNMKIYEIAESIGIEDTTYFSHFFKKYAGMSPKQYKDRYSN